MRKYETVLVFSPELTEHDLKEELKKLENTLQLNGAVEIKSDRWGKQELGFKMKGKSFGSYISITYQAKNPAIQDTLTGILRIHDRVLKFQTHRISDAVRKVRVNPKRVSSPDSNLEDMLDLGEGDIGRVRI